MPQILWSFLFVFHVAAKDAQPCAPDLTPRDGVAPTSARIADAALRAQGFGKRARGYAVLIGAMVASAAATTYLTTHLAPDLQLLSQLIGQVSTLGVYVFGAPIWEPLSSTIRKFAFGIEEGTLARGTPGHEAQWHRTQNTYSINDQMGRNIAPSFLSANLQMFYEARRAMLAHDDAYAVDQVAVAAQLLRRHFADLAPDDPSVTDAVRASFTRHVPVDAAFRRRVEARLATSDAAWESPEVRRHYDETLDAWLGTRSH